MKATVDIVDDYDVVVDTIRMIRQRQPSIGLTESLETKLIRSASMRVALKFASINHISWDHRKLVNRS
ncbi:MAG: hypothetical protein F4227_03275 [Gammaproteobacteria bacterium]|nr:hypothetical protein [Gammaproteobacteria bacterium]MYF02013.1 hypothetical protein [Gammaproteobacteria bacterium]MYI77547.1 hypothetical protein [Gammaproteobacteria bacterium]